MQKTSGTKPISNVEFALLQLIAENGELSGYMISQLIEERGYREWADIGETSIYTGLEKLHKKELVEFYLDIEKQGKGPLPKKFTLTAQGKVLLKEEILAALAATRERDQRFDIALAAILFVKPADALQALELRKLFLASEMQRIDNKFNQQDGLAFPKHVQILFKHPIILIKAELGFVDEVINAIKTIQGDTR